MKKVMFSMIIDIILIAVLVIFLTSGKKQNNIINKEEVDAIEEEIIELPPLETEVDEVTDQIESSVSVVYENVWTVSKDVSNFYGMLTHYGPDCKGCIGVTASGYDVHNTIWYNDSEYGNIRILAGPKEVPFYTVLSINNYSGDKILAIVLDRGGAINGNHFDLLVGSETEPVANITQYDVEFEIVRWGK